MTYLLRLLRILQGHTSPYSSNNRKLLVKIHKDRQTDFIRLSPTDRWLLNTVGRLNILPNPNLLHRHLSAFSCALFPTSPCEIVVRRHIKQRTRSEQRLALRAFIHVHVHDLSSIRLNWWRTRKHVASFGVRIPFVASVNDRHAAHPLLIRSTHLSIRCLRENSRLHVTWGFL